jgi:hypothetical protein
VHGVQRHARVIEPLRKRPDCRLIVVVEVRSRGEELDAVEAVRRDVDEVFPVEPLLVKEMRGHAKAQVAHTGILTPQFTWVQDPTASRVRWNWPQEDGSLSGWISTQVN